MSERDICERLEDAISGAKLLDHWYVILQPTDATEAAAAIRTLRDTLRRADALLAEGVGAAEEGDTADWRARVREFLGERS